MNGEKESWELIVETFQSFRIISFDLRGSFLMKLLELNVIDKNQETEILCEPDVESRLKKLLRILFDSREENVFSVFHNVVKEHYTWITELIEEVASNTDSESMIESMKERVRHHRTTIISNIDPTYTVDTLCTRNIMNRETFQFDSQSMKIRALNLVSFLLVTTDPEAFVLFTDILKHDYSQICNLNFETATRNEGTYEIEIKGCSGHGRIYIIIIIIMIINFYSSVSMSNTRCHSIGHKMRIARIKIRVDS